MGVPPKFMKPKKQPEKGKEKVKVDDIQKWVVPDLSILLMSGL